jgi:hypothetical protein
MKGYLFSFVALATVCCFAFTSCNGKDDKDEEAPLEFSVGSDVYNVKAALQTIIPDGDTTFCMVALASDGLTYDAAAQTVTGTGYALVCEFAFPSTTKILPAGKYSVFTGTSNPPMGAMAVMVVEIKNGEMDETSTTYECTSGSMTVSKTDEEYTIDFSGKDKTGKDIKCHYKGVILYLPTTTGTVE